MKNGKIPILGVYFGVESQKKGLGTKLWSNHDQMDRFKPNLIFLLLKFIKFQLQQLNHGFHQGTTQVMLSTH
jgi:hypothetical protein